MEGDGSRSWTLLTSHGHVLVEIARNPQARVRDISAAIGITERATQSIISDLEQAGYVERVRVGRRTHYVLFTDNPFRHSAQDGLRIGPFLELLTSATSTAADRADGPLTPPLEPELVAAAMEAATPGPLSEVPAVELTAVDLPAADLPAADLPAPTVATAITAVPLPASDTPPATL
jgi:hypothetical protein